MWLCKERRGKWGELNRLQVKPNAGPLCNALINTNHTNFVYVIGLFLADQQLHGDNTIYTRQNAGGSKRGFEVPEERDYYPYWGPTPWKDIAIMVSDEETKDLMRTYVNSSEYGRKCEC